MAGFHTNLTIDGFSYYSGNFPPEISGNFRTYNLNGCDMVHGQLLCSTAVASLIMMLMITYLVFCMQALYAIAISLTLMKSTCKEHYRLQFV